MKAQITQKLFRNIVPLKQQVITVIEKATYREYVYFVDGVRVSKRENFLVNEDTYYIIDINA